MDIQKQKNLYLAKLLEQEVIKQDEFDDLVFKPEINAFHSNYLSSRFMDNINFGWSAWQAAKVESHKQAALYQFEINHLAQANQQWREKAAKTQAVPEGFVLIKDDTKTVVAIERMVEQQVEASGMDSRRLERLDGWKIIEAAVEAQEPAND
ncbi:hypothetical protein PYR78_06375 [Acinetobacter johnsonii]|nr:hypothetical protein PYR78_06375 [Acinetobacter johnsonii]